MAAGTTLVKGPARSPRPDGGVTSETACWHVLLTKCRQEKMVAETLAAAGIEHYLPLTRQVRFYGARKFKVETPLFPGYLFLRGTTEDWYFAERTRRVAQVISVRDQASFERDLAQVRRALDCGAPLAPAAWLKDGIRVEVTAGPFRGVQGFVDQLLRDDRLLLRVELLSRAAQLEIDRSLLRPVI
jgi:transcription termination/antitermination protein NusG